MAAGLIPPRPNLIVGRNDDIAKLMERFIRNRGSEQMAVQTIAAVRGWPGVGKTTLAVELLYREETQDLFPDGVLWAALGKTPDIRGCLAQWARAMDDMSAAQLADAKELGRRLAMKLRQRRMLLVVDDVWRAQDAKWFLIGGAHCGMLITTRLPGVAEELTPSPAHRHYLDILSESDALELLRTLSPECVAGAPEASASLVRELEGLPLAIQVAGRLLRAESRVGDRGQKVKALLADVREGARRLLEQPAPVDVGELLGEKFPTIAALLERSTDSLDEKMRGRFAALSLYPPKPATFDVQGLAEVWGVSEDEALSSVHELVERGLLEPVARDRVQCHALLIAHAARLAEKLS